MQNHTFNFPEYGTLEIRRLVFCAKVDTSPAYYVGMTVDCAWADDIPANRQVNIVKAEVGRRLGIVNPMVNLYSLRVVKIIPLGHLTESEYLVTPASSTEWVGYAYKTQFDPEPAPAEPAPKSEAKSSSPVAGRRALSWAALAALAIWVLFGCVCAAIGYLCAG